MEIIKNAWEAQSCCWHHAERSPQSHMAHSLGNGNAGITRGIPIPFQDLFIRYMVNFLAYLYDGKGYQYCSLNAYRSATSSVHTKVDGFHVWEHPLVARPLKGAFNQHTPQPKYQTTWLGCGSGHRLLREVGVEWCSYPPGGYRKTGNYAVLLGQTI